MNCGLGLFAIERFVSARDSWAMGAAFQQEGLQASCLSEQSMNNISVWTNLFL